MLTSNFEQVGRFEEHRLPDGTVLYYEPDKHAYYGEIKASPRAKGGYSFVRDSRLTGISHIGKYLDVNVDPFLWWASKLDQTGIAELASQAIAAGADLTWLGDQRSIAEALREAELTWMHVRDRRAEEGTNVHERITFALATGSEPPTLANLSEQERGYGQAKMAWWRDRQPEPIAAEQVTASPSKGIAGRFDLLCNIDGERVLVDDKTREKGAVRKSDHAQLAGYEVANVDCGIGASDRQIVLILMPDGTYREEEGLATEADFYSALNACRSGKHLDKRMREAEKAREAVAA